MNDDDDTQGYLAAQPKREWVGLTAADVHAAFLACLDEEDEVGLFAQTIEAKLKEKNHG